MARKTRRLLASALTLLVLIAGGVVFTSAESANSGVSPVADTIWAQHNLVAWCVVPFDAKMRGPEERAQMLANLGFKHFAYDWRDKDIPTFDAEIDALQKHGIDLLGWWFPLDADNPLAKTTLEVFKRHHVHPQLWVALSSKNGPQTPEDWAKLLPKEFPMPKTDEDFAKLSDNDKAEFERILVKLNAEDFPKTAAEQEHRVKTDADRINSLIQLAKPYGSKVELYNHTGWFGMIENQLAIINRLKEMGVANVGMVYNFSHARDERHDDSKTFPALWSKMKPHVVVVNITGMRWEDQVIYPSQGDSELNMMRTIQDSGWSGPVGVIAEKGGDAELTLKNYITGLDWLASELGQPGSGGPRPFPPAQ